MFMTMLLSSPRVENELTITLRHPLTRRDGARRLFPRDDAAAAAVSIAAGGVAFSIAAANAFACPRIRSSLAVASLVLVGFVVDLADPDRGSLVEIKLRGQSLAPGLGALCADRVRDRERPAAFFGALAELLDVNAAAHSSGLVPQTIAQHVPLGVGDEDAERLVLRLCTDRRVPEILNQQAVLAQQGTKVDVGGPLRPMPAVFRPGPPALQERRRQHVKPSKTVICPNRGGGVARRIQNTRPIPIVGQNTPNPETPARFIHVGQNARPMRAK